MLFAVPNDHTEWKFVIMNTEIPIPKTPDVRVKFEQLAQEQRLKIQLSNISYPVPEDGNFLITDNSRGSELAIELTLSTNSWTAIDLGDKSKIDWEDGKMVYILWRHAEYDTQLNVGSVRLNKKET